MNLWDLIGYTKYFAWTGYKQMKILIKRLDVTDHGIFGHLTLDGSPFNCVTLERHDICIPIGTYKAVLYKSPDHNGMTVILLQNVPGRSFIEIHPGNWEYQSKGCILVATERDGYSIDHSQDAFEDLIQQLKGCEDITVTIS